MTSHDVEGVYSISKASFSQSWSKASIAKEVVNPTASYFVAELEGTLIGYGGMWHMMDEGEIINIAVTKENRQHKVGSLLLEALLSEAREKGIKSVFLEVRASNRVAQGLYKKYHFKEIGRRKNYYHEPTEDAVNMICEL